MSSAIPADLSNYFGGETYVNVNPLSLRLKFEGCPIMVQLGGSSPGQIRRAANIARRMGLEPVNSRRSIDSER